MTFQALLVREMRIELTLGYQYAPQTYASTNSATRAAICNCVVYFNENLIETQEYHSFCEDFSSFGAL